MGQFWAIANKQLEDMSEEQGGEGGLLEDAKNDKDKLTKTSITARLKDIKADNDAVDELQVLKNYLALIEQQSEISSKIKLAKELLDAKVFAKYAELTEDEIKKLVVDDKWLVTLTADVQSELNRVSQTLTIRVRELADRYASPLPQIVDSVAVLTSRFEEHLKKMGVTWM